PEIQIFDFLYTNQNNQDAIKKKENSSTFGRKKVPEKVTLDFPCRRTQLWQQSILLSSKKECLKTEHTN
ncbi:hypothetical protein, partial [Phocaeicola plebeius]|uniref:hypothetical protein n=1 Tax=Phocaeicola plebeius TaxID=310297 RepID=UPI0026F1C33E